MNIWKKLLVLLFLAAVSAGTAAQDCDEGCLIDIAQQYLADVATQDYSDLPWGERVRYTENNVAMMIGDGFWGAGPAVGEGFFVADAASGNVVWLGITSEHGQAAYHGLRLMVEERRITEVESYLGREGTPDLFAPADGYAASELFAGELPPTQRRPRQRMIAIVDGYFNTRQLNDGKIFTTFAQDCARITNGVDATHGEHWAAAVAQGCEAQMAQGLYRPVDNIRARRYPVVSEETGVVAALSIEDHAARYVDYQSADGTPLEIQVEYPNSRGRLELFRIADGEIQRIEGVSVFLPYYIHSLWP